MALTWWEIWKGAGAVGGVEEAGIQSARQEGPLRVTGIGEHHVGPAAGMATLSLGSQVVAEGVLPDSEPWRVEKPLEFLEGANP